MFPKKSVSQNTISGIRLATCERINQCLLDDARQEKMKRGHTARIDSTVTSTIIHTPRDSSLLWDSVLVMAHLLEEAQALPGAATIEFRNH